MKQVLNQALVGAGAVQVSDPVSEQIRCQCDGCPSENCGGKNPAIYSVNRDGGRLLLCSRCVLAGDEKTLMPDIDLDQAIAGAGDRYDAIDLMLIGMEAAELNDGAEEVELD